jgi:basic amino acid/polyamine antiporter, APA family
METKNESFQDEEHRCDDCVESKSQQPYQQFLGIDRPVALALQCAKEHWFAGFVDFGAILGMTTVILVMCYGQTHIVFAMSREGLLPTKFSTIHPKFGTPFLTTWSVGSLFSIIGAVVPLGVLAELVNIGTLAAFCLVPVAVIILRKKRPNLPRAFLCPGVPAVPVLAIAFCLVLMAYLKPMTWIAFGAWLTVGAFAYFAYARHKSVLQNEATEQGYEVGERA